MDTWSKCPTEQYGTRQYLDCPKRKQNNSPHRMLASPLCMRKLEHAYGRSEASLKVVFVCYIYNSLLQLIVLVLGLTRTAFGKLPTGNATFWPHNGQVAAGKIPQLGFSDARSVSWLRSFVGVEAWLSLLERRWKLALRSAMRLSIRALTRSSAPFA